MALRLYKLAVNTVTCKSLAAPLSELASRIFAGLIGATVPRLQIQAVCVGQASLLSLIITL